MEIVIARKLINKTLESLLFERCELVNTKDDMIICKPKNGKLIELIRFLARNRIPYKLVSDR